MGLRSLYNKFVKKDDEYESLERQTKIEKRIQEKQLGADERELNKFLEEDRQRQIRQQLSNFRKQRQDEVWHGDTSLDAPNVIKNQKNLFSHQKNMFGWKSNNVKGNDIFFR